MKTRDMALTAVMAALICVVAPIVVPLPASPVPLSLATFMIYLAAAVLGAKRGALAVALYLLIGAVGLPVFSGFTGGAQKLAGVTGGYLIGYLPCAFIAGLAAAPGRGAPARKWRLPLFMALGTAALYALGTAWFMVSTKNGLAASLGMCVLLFLPGDAIKIAAASLLAGPIRRAVYRK